MSCEISREIALIDQLLLRPGGSTVPIENTEKTRLRTVKYDSVVALSAITSASSALIQQKVELLLAYKLCNDAIRLECCSFASWKDLIWAIILKVGS